MRCRSLHGLANAAYLEGFPFLAVCCTVLRSRWYQSGINRGINAERGYAQWCEEVEELIYSAKEQRAEAS